MRKIFKNLTFKKAKFDKIPSDKKESKMKEINAINEIKKDMNFKIVTLCICIALFVAKCIYTQNFKQTLLDFGVIWVIGIIIIIGIYSDIKGLKHYKKYFDETDSRK